MSSEETTPQTPAWAVYVGEHGDDECIPLLAESEEDARKLALESAEDGDEVTHIDGPYENSEPGVWEFEFRTEHREKVVVKAPNEDYAEEMADAERDYGGQYVQTVHTESRKVMSAGGSDE